MKHELKNTAALEENKLVDHSDCEYCKEDYLFAMKDRYHEFSVGLRTILDCLEMAEKEGAVPKLSDQWWLDVKNRYYQFREHGCI